MSAIDPMEKIDHDRLLVRLSQMFYFGGRSMVQIADELKISRFRVARLLEEAQQRGAVKITLHRPTQGKNDLATRLKARYGLRHVEVVDADGMSEQQLRAVLGVAGARLLQTLLTDGDVLGIGWGRAVEAVADAAGPSLPRCPVVQLSGITGHPSSNSVELVRRFAALTGDAAYPLYVPLIVPDPATAQTLRESEGIAETFAQFRDVSVALVAIGSWTPPNSQLYTVVSPRMRDALTHVGLQAEIGGIFINEQGQEVDLPVARQIMSISARQLAQIPTVVAVAGTTSKVRAIRAAIMGGYVNALVTDSYAAQRLLAS